jgi:hypothetical protein
MSAIVCCNWGLIWRSAWSHPSATAVTRKRIIRVVLREVVARVEGEQIHLLLHWQGGDHTRLTVRKKPKRPNALGR